MGVITIFVLFVILNRLKLFVNNVKSRSAICFTIFISTSYSTVIFITNQISTMENYKVNQKVQALEPVFKIWLNAIVKNANKKQIFIRWIGYSSVFDLWIDRANVRLPESKNELCCKETWSRKKIFRSDRNLQIFREEITSQI